MAEKYNPILLAEVGDALEVLVNNLAEPLDLTFEYEGHKYVVKQAAEPVLTKDGIPCQIQDLARIYERQFEIMVQRYEEAKGKGKGKAKGR